MLYYNVTSSMNGADDGDDGVGEINKQHKTSVVPKVSKTSKGNVTEDVSAPLHHNLIYLSNTSLTLL